MKKGLLLVLLLIMTTLFGNATELTRNGWNLISVCQDMNRSQVNMDGIEEIQSQEGQTIYTGDFATYSNLNTLQAGYGYWVKGEVGTNFNSGESRNRLEKPLNRNGWNLMASCEEIPRADVNMTNFVEIQNQNGHTIYTGDFVAYSNLDRLESGYGYWVKGNQGTLFTSQRGLRIPIGFDYQTINNLGMVVQTNYEGYLVKLYANYQEVANDKQNHTGIGITVNGNSLPIIQIQGTYKGHEIVVALYNSLGKLVAISGNITVDSVASVTLVDLVVEDSYSNGGYVDPYGNGGGYVDPYGNGGGYVDPYGNGGGYVDPYGNGGGYVDPYGNGGGYVDPYGNGGGYVDPYGNGGGYVDPYGNGGGYVDPYGNGGGYVDPYQSNGLLITTPIYSDESNIIVKVQGNSGDRLIINGTESSYFFTYDNQIIDVSLENNSSIVYDLQLQKSDGTLSETSSFQVSDDLYMNLTNYNLTNQALSTHRNNSYAKYYSFSLQSERNITIDLMSSFDTYLYLLEGNGREGNVIASNDDNGANLNSRISGVLPMGDYTIEVASFSQYTEGLFDLKLSPMIDVYSSLRNKLAGKTYYLPYQDQNGTKVIRELSFNQNLSTLTWQEVEGGSASGTSTITLDYSMIDFHENRLILDGETYFSIDLYNNDSNETQPLNANIYRNYYNYNGNSSNSNFPQGSFKLFSSQEEVHTYLSNLLAGQTVYIPNYEENRIEEVVFNEEFSTVTRTTTDSIEAFGDRLYIGANGVMTLRYNYGDNMSFDYQGLDEHNQTVYESINTYRDRENAQQRLDEYNSQPHIYFSENNINMNVGETRTIGYTTRNVDTLRLENTPDFVTLDETNNSIIIDMTNIQDSQSFEVRLIGTDNETGYETWEYLQVYVYVDEATRLKNKLAGKTYYLPYVEDNGTKVIRELTFDDNLSTLTWQEVEGGSASGSSTITLDSSNLILDGETYFYVDYYNYNNDETQPLNAYIYRCLEDTNITTPPAEIPETEGTNKSSKSEVLEEGSFKEGSFKLFSSQEEVHTYLSNLLAGNTYYIPNYEENRIEEVVFNEEFSTVTRTTTDSIEAFGDRLYIGANGVMTLRYNYGDNMLFDYEGLDEHNQTVYESIYTYRDRENAQQELDYYNSQPHIYFSENNINMNVGETRTIGYTTRNVDTLRLENTPDFVTLDETNQSIIIDTTNVQDSQSFHMYLIGTNNEMRYEIWSYIWVNITSNESDPYANDGVDPYNP